MIYSIAVGGTVSIAHLLVAGFLPGLLLGLALSILVLITAYRENYPKGEVVPFRKAVKVAIEALWGLVTMLIITGGILLGVSPRPRPRRSPAPGRSS